MYHGHNLPASFFWVSEGSPSAQAHKEGYCMGGNAKPCLDLPAKLLVICTLMEMKGASSSYLNFLNECASTEVNEEVMGM